MSQQTPEEIRAEIERTRQRLGADVDAVAEKVNPESVVERKKNQARSKIQDIREQVMGVADHAGDSAQDLRHGVAERVSDSAQALGDAPQIAKAKTRGNPLAAGLIAVGAGWLIGSLLPSTSKEQELTSHLAQQAQPQMQQAAQSVKTGAQEIVENLKQPAQQAAESVKQTAQSGAEELKQHGKQAASELKDSAADSAKTVKNAAQ